MKHSPITTYSSRTEPCPHCDYGCSECDRGEVDAVCAECGDCYPLNADGVCNWCADQCELSTPAFQEKWLCKHVLRDRDGRVEL